MRGKLEALTITTSHDRLGDNGKRTGVFGSEMTAPYYEFSGGGMTVDVASIKGGEIPIDPMSFIWPMRLDYGDRYLKDPEFQMKVEDSLKISDIDFTDYDIVYLAGGWGAAFLGDERKHYSGPVTVGKDGMLFSLPAESDEIIAKWLL